MKKLLHQKFLHGLLLFALLMTVTVSFAAAGFTPPTNGILYVKKGETGNGSSWGNALGEVADALKTASELNAVTPGTVTQIWVAGGTYKPLYRADNFNGSNPVDRDNAFVLVKDVKMYGGFAGSEVNLTDRNLTLTANKSTLSGDYNGDDVVTGSALTLAISNNTENALHVVVCTATTDPITNATVLDGFTVTGGSANISTPITTAVNGIQVSKSVGGGMYNVKSSPILSNIIFDGNVGGSTGGGIYNYDHSSPIMTNCAIVRNLGGSVGGMQNTLYCSPIITNTIIKDNSYAINNTDHSSPVFTNIIVTGHSTGIYDADGTCSSTITNATISGNTTGVFCLNGGAPKIRNSIIYGNGSGAVGINATPTITNSLVQDIVATGTNLGGSTDPLFVDAANGNYKLQACSPAVNAGNNGYFAAGATPDLSAITVDYAGDARIQDTTIDMGAYEFEPLDIHLNLISASLAIGDVCINTNGDGSFVFNATNMTNATLLVNAVAGYNYSLTQNGTYTPTLTLTGYNNETVTVYVRLTPTALQNYNGNINIVAQENLSCVDQLTMPVAGKGVNIQATATTGAAPLSVTLTTATLPGTSVSGGCSATTAYGIEYSISATDLTGGLGIQVAGTNINAGNYSVDINGLNPCTDYYYRAYTVNQEGTVYGAVKSFTTVATPVAIAAGPINGTDFTANWNTVTDAWGYYLDVSTSPTFGSSSTQTVTETLVNAPTTSLFAPRAWTGDGGITWTADMAALTSSGGIKVIRERSLSATADGKITSGIISGGTSQIKFNYKAQAGSSTNIGTLVVKVLTGTDFTNVAFTQTIPYTTTLNLFTGTVTGVTGDYKIEISVGGGVGKIIEISNISFTAIVFTPSFVAGYNNLNVANVTSYNVMGLNPSTTYYYRMRVNTGCISVNSNTIPVTTTVPAVAGVMYVKKGATGNGSSWANALGEVSDALKTAKQLNAVTPGTVTEIWVAGGTYKPQYNGALASSGDKNRTFLMVKGVKVYGGFAGTEASLTQRDLSLTANASILDGDHSNNDAFTGYGSTLFIGSGSLGDDNSRHIVCFVQPSTDPIGAETVLDGFTITGAALGSTATGGPYINGIQVHDSFGGGIVVKNGSPILSNLFITENWNDTGAAIDITVSPPGSTESSPIMTNCLITKNYNSFGGAISAQNSAAVFTNLTIAGNNLAFSVSISGSLIAQLRNSIVYGNADLGTVDVMNISNSLVQGLTSTANGNISGTMDPYLKDPLNGDYTLGCGSPAINAGSNSYFAAGATPDLSIYTTDLSGDARIQDTTIDMGVFEREPINRDIVLNSASLTFGDICTGNGADGSFVFNGVNMVNATLTVEALTGYTYSLIQNGTYTSTLTITGYNNAATTIYVKFNPTVVQDYSANIIVNAQENLVCVDKLTVPVTGKGITIPAVVTTGTPATDITVTTATFPGTSTASACAATTAYGIEYSTSATDLTAGLGTQISASNISAGNYTAAVSGLTGCTTYYYRAYTTNASGTVYGTQQSFTTLTPSAPVAVTAGTINATGFTANWNPVGTATGYSLDVSTSPTFGASAAQVITETLTNAATNSVFGVKTWTGDGNVAWTSDMATIVFSSAIKVIRQRSISATVPGTLTSGVIAGGTTQIAFKHKAQTVSAIGTLVVKILTGPGFTNVAFTQTIPYTTTLTQFTAPVTGVTGDYKIEISVGGGVNKIVEISSMSFDSLTFTPSFVTGYDNLNVGNITSYDVTGLTVNTTYYYRVRATTGCTLTNSNTIPVTTVEPPVAGVMYVKKGSTGNGSSWTNALGEVADALKNAKQLNTTTPGTVTQIWVAGGTYKPQYNGALASVSNKTGTFLMVKGVKVYGGFAGTESSLTQRDLSLTANTSILDGDHSNNDIMTGYGSTISVNQPSTTDNSFHVVCFVQPSTDPIGNETVLDGFKITGGAPGNTVSGGPFINGVQVHDGFGAGIVVKNGSPILANLFITENWSSNGGAALDITVFPTGESSPVVTNCLITRNYDGLGGTIRAQSSAAVFTNLTVAGNRFYAFSIGTSGNLIPSLRNSIVYGNDDLGTIASMNISNSLVQGLTSTQNGNIDGSTDPLFTDAVNGDFTLKCGSPALNTGNNILFNGVTTPNLSGYTTDLFGKIRIQDTTIDMGALEAAPYTPPAIPTATPLVFSCVVATVADLTVTAGANIKWYAAATGGSALTATTVLVTGNYYASQTVSGCESARTQVAVTVNSTPIAPAAAPITLCGTPTVNDLTVTSGTAPKWYTVSTGGTALAPTDLATTGTYYVSQTVNGCESARTLVNVTIGSGPAAPTASAQAFCGSATASQLTVTTGTAPQWYTASTGGTALLGTTALVTGNYYVSQTVNGCVSARTEVAVTINAVPLAPGAFNQIFCGTPVVADLLVTLEPGAVKKWYASATAPAELASTTLLVSQSYFVSQTINGCESPRKEIAVTVNFTPAVTAIDQTFCTGATVSNLATTSGGTNIKWYTSATSTQALLPTDAIATGTYYVSQTLNACESARISINVTFSQPAAPTAVAQAFCGSPTVNELVVTTGTAPQWYTASTGGTPLALTTALVTGNYYVSQTVNGCESTRTEVAVTVNAVPVAPTASPQAFCGAATINNLTVTGTNVQWYAASTGGAPLAITTALVTGNYYASQTVNGCESARTAVAVTVNAIAAAPTASAQAFCGAATISNLAATGTNIQWYAASTGGTPLAVTTALVTGNYYVSQTANGCESVRTAVAVTVNAIAAAPTAVAQAFCGSATISNLAATGVNVQWYAASTGGTALALTTVLATGNYYVSQTINGCESPRTEVAVTVNAIPAVPTAAAQAFCGSATVGQLTATGTALQWYAASTGGTALALTTALTTGNYYVSQTVNGCESPRTAVAVTVNQVPLMPAAFNQIFCGTPTIANLEVTLAGGAAKSWYATAAATTPLAETTPLVTQTYYVSQTINGCESPRKAIIVVVNYTPPLTAIDQTLCTGAEVSDLTTTSGGTNIKWYVSETSIQALLPTDVVTTGTYYVSQTLNACESVRIPVHVTTSKPVAPAASAQAFCNSATVSELTVTTGTDPQWYSSPTGGIPLAVNTVLATGNYYVSQTINGCEGERAEVAVTISPKPIAPTATAQVFCGSTTVNQLTAAGAAPLWYAAATGGTALAGTTVLVTGNYYVSQTVNGCESERTQVAVTVGQGALTPDASDQSFCGGATVASLEVTLTAGAVEKWYATADAITPLADTTPLASQSYFVSQTINGCESSRKEVVVTVTITPAIAITSLTVCTGTQAGSLASLGGTNVRWYTSQTVAEALLPTDVVTTGTYYASQTINGCESLRILVNITTVSLTAPEAVAIQDFTAGQTLADLDVTGIEGAAIIWYADAELTIVLPATTLLTDGTIYYAVQQLGNCSSTSVAVTAHDVLATGTFTKDVLTLYPNPVKELLTITYSEAISSVEVYDLLGKVVLTKTPNATEVKVDMSALAAGTYIIRVHSGNMSNDSKVIKH